jgi:hypothetical protein
MGMAAMGTAPYGSCPALNARVAVQTVSKPLTTSGDCLGVEHQHVRGGCRAQAQCAC